MIHPNKATKLLSDYAKNNYNAYKTLLENGYSETTAKAQAKKILNSATNRVASQLQLDTRDTKEVAKKSYEIVGLQPEDIAEKLKEIATSKDYTNALKILSVLAKDIGLNITDNEQQKAPAVNITVEKLNTDNSGIRDIEAS